MQIIIGQKVTEVYENQTYTVEEIGNYVSLLTKGFDLPEPDEEYVLEDVWVGITVRGVKTGINVAWLKN